MHYIGGVFVIGLIVVMISILTYYSVKKEVGMVEDKEIKTVNGEITIDDVDRIYINDRIKEYLDTHTSRKHGIYEGRYNKAMRNEILKNPDLEYFDQGIIKFPDGTTLGNHCMEVGGGMDFSAYSMYVQISKKKWLLVGIGMDSDTLKHYDRYISPEYSISPLDSRFSEQDRKDIENKNAKLNDPLFWLSSYMTEKVSVKEIK